jgi:pimeloyl-ACP methyl ester carboxylesterase
MKYVGDEVKIELIDEKVSVNGFLAQPEEVEQTVIFAHGSGSSRFSPRNQFVARYLHEQQLGTLLIDLLTPEEEALDAVTAELRFDIDLLAKRLIGVTKWFVRQKEFSGQKVSYFGSSTGAAAALIAAAEKGNKITSVVSRGGRPDLAGPYLSKVNSCVLLIVGGEDDVVIDLNKQALELLPGEKQLEIIPGATHLFEEPGTLEEVARLAAIWFKSH